MKKHPFKVRKDQNADAVEFKISLPSSMDDAEMIEVRFGTVERMIDRACSQLIVDIAPGIRKRLPNVETAEAYVAEYCDNGSRDEYVRPSISASEAKDEQGFTDAQLEWIAARGVAVFIGPADDDMEIVGMPKA